MCICIKKNMIKNRLFIYTWPIIAFACEFFVLVYFWSFLFYSSHSLLDGSHVLRHLAGYVDIITMTNFGKVYFGIAFPVLILSYVLWFKNPGKKTFLFSMFTTWVLCGYPGVSFLLILAWRFGW